MASAARKFASIFMSCVLAIALVPSIALADENDATGGAQNNLAAQPSENGDTDSNGLPQENGTTTDDANGGTITDNSLDSGAAGTGEGADLGTSSPSNSEDAGALGSTRSVTDTEAVSDEATAAPVVTYSTHVQSIGWQKSVETSSIDDVAIAGTTGKSLRLEAIKIAVSGVEDLGIQYKTHVQKDGWNDWSKDGGQSGTTGRSLRLEAIQIELTGDAAANYDVYYRVHCQNKGWMGWAKNGDPAGSQGFSLRLEAIQIVIVPAGSDAPGATAGAFTKATGDGEVNYRAHVQSIGWQGYVSDGKTSGTTGRSLRLEAVSLNVSNIADLGIEYRTHVQSKGWTSYVADGANSGSTGSSLRLEAIQIRLTGSAAANYDVYYRVHCQSIGWMGWAKNDEIAGTTAASLRVEAFEVQLVKKGAEAPGDTAGAYKTLSWSSSANVQGSGWQNAVSGAGTIGTTGKSKAITQFRTSLVEQPVSGSLQYRVHSSNIGWQSWVSSNAVAGNSNNRIEAINIRLTGTMASLYDVYYRVHVSNIGWMGWAKNGANAGTTTLSLGVEAVQIKLVIKGAGAPGSTANAYRDYAIVSGNATLDKIIDTVLDKTGRGSGALRRAYDYVVNNYSYANGSKNPTGNWSISFAIEMYNNKRGNCYRFAALFYWLARGLGYSAAPISGYVPSVSGGRAAHGWVEVYSGGQTYICDPDLQKEIPYCNWFWVTYANAPTWYYK